MTLEKLVDYVSMREVLDSVSKQVPIPENWAKILPLTQIPTLSDIGPYKNQTQEFHKASHSLRLSALNDLFQAAYRYSEAAPVLDQYFHNALNQGPKWFDWRETGRPKISNAARDEALMMLVYMVNYFPRCLEDFRTGRYDRYPHHGIPTHEGMFENPNGADRIQQIVFERKELLEFLNHIGIPHSLDTAALSIQPAVSDHEIGLEGKATLANAGSVSAVTVEPTSTIHRATRPGDHKLRRCIDKARSEVLNPNDVQEVWIRLQEMAEGRNGIRPSEMRAFVIGKGIEYLNGETITYFTKNLLGKQFANERAKQRQKKSQADDLVP